MKSLCCTAAVVVGLLIPAIDAARADITWGSAQAFSSAADVRTVGTLVESATIYNGGDLSVNGVTFSRWAGQSYNGSDWTMTFNSSQIAWDANNVINGTSAGGATDFDKLVANPGGNYVHYPGGSGSTVTLGGLTPGNSYEVQLIVGNTSYTACPDNVVNVGANQYVIGTFTASGATQQFYYGGTAGSSNPFFGFSAIQVRDVTPGDVTPPSWDATPTVDNANSGGFTVHADIDEAGTAYYVVLANGAAAPTASAVKNHSGSPAAYGSIALGTTPFSGLAPVTGLDPGTDYDVYFAAEDAALNLQADVTVRKVDAQTAAADTTPPSWDGTPTVDSANSGGFTVHADIDEAGTAYYVVLANGAAAPSALAVKNHSGSPAAYGSIALGTTPFSGSTPVTGLNPGTDYDVYFAAEDDESPTPNLQANGAVQKVDAQTAAIPPGVMVWGTPQTLSSALDVSTAGTFVDSATLYNVADLAVNGVTFKHCTGNNYGPDGLGHLDWALTFAGGQIALHANNHISGTANGGATDFDKLVANPGADTAYYNGQVGGVVTLNGLQNGKTYAVQVFVGNQSYTAQLDDSVNVGANKTVIGTFTASGTSQTFTYAGSSGPSNPFYGLSAVQVRDTSPGDTTPPSWDATPTVDTVTTGGFTVHADIDEAGTAYYVVLANGAAAPSALAVKNGSGSPAAYGSIALGTTPFSGSTPVTGLNPGTDYDVYFAAEDDESPTPNLQANGAVQKVDAQTVAADTTPPSWAATPTVDSANSGGFTVHAAINEAGTAYYVVLANGAVAPTASAVKNHSGSPAAYGSIALGTTPFSGSTPVTGLNPGTDYDVYFAAEDDESPTPNLQANGAVQKVDAQTAAIPPGVMVWGTPQTLSSALDVSTAGTFVDSATLYNVADLAVNGVTFKHCTGNTYGADGLGHSDWALTFAGGQIALHANNHISGTANGGATDFDKLVANPGADIAYYNSEVGGVVTLNGLQNGKTYAVQVFAGTLSYTAQLDNSVNVGANQYVIGTFTASGTSQTFTYAGSSGPSNPFYGLSAVQVRDTTPSYLGTVLRFK